MKQTIRYSTLFLIALCSFFVINSQNADSNTLTKKTLIVNVTGTGCESVTIYTFENGNLVYLYPQTHSSCTYEATVGDGEYIVYACVSDKHGDVQVKIAPGDAEGNATLELVPGVCPYGGI